MLERIEFYCPCCGVSQFGMIEKRLHSEVAIAPGQVVKCEECESEFRLEFTPIDDELGPP